MKIFLETYTNSKYICVKNNIAQLYFMSGGVELCLIFFSLRRDPQMFNSAPGQDPLSIRKHVSVRIF